MNNTLKDCLLVWIMLACMFIMHMLNDISKRIDVLIKEKPPIEKEK